MGAPTKTPTERITDLMHKRRFRAAYALGEELSFTRKAPLDIHLRYQHLLAGLQVFGPDRVQKLIDAVYNDDNVTDTMKGDVQRDLALAYIRRGTEDDFDKAERRLSKAERLYRTENDANRHIALIAAEGRMWLANRSYLVAHKLLLRADHEWEGIGDQADPTYVRNNRFQLYRAQVATEQIQSWVYKEVTNPELEPSSTRRLRARLLYLFGHHWIPVDRWLEQRL